MQTIHKLQSAARGARSIGNYADAEDIHRRVLQLIVQRHGASSHEYAQCLGEIAEICELKEEWALSEQLYKEAAIAYGTLYQTSQASIALILRNLAEVCRHQGKNTDAKLFEMEAAAILSSRMQRTRDNSRMCSG